MPEEREARGSFHTESGFWYLTFSRSSTSDKGLSETMFRIYLSFACLLSKAMCLLLSPAGNQTVKFLKEPEAVLTPRLHNPLE